MLKTVIAYEYNYAETNFSQIHEQIKNDNYRFTPLNNSQRYTQGFDRFFDDVFIIEADNRILLNVTFSSKKISPTAVKNLLAERLEAVKKEQNIESVSDDAVAIYTQEIENNILKYTAPINKTVRLLIDKNTHHIYVDAPSSLLAEDALHQLRKMIGTLVCRYISSQSANEIFSDLIQPTSSTSLGYLRIAEYPSVEANSHKEAVKISLSGICRHDDLFTDLFIRRQIKSLEFELFSQNNHLTIATFQLCVGKNGQLIIKKFSFDEPDDANSDEHIDDSSYRYTSKMLLVGRYMAMILESLNGFLEIDNHYEKTDKKNSAG